MLNILRIMATREQDIMVSSIITTDSHLPVYQDLKELKRKRNRLAQRKHRQGLAQGGSSNNKRNAGTERIAAKLQPLPTEPMPTNFSDSLASNDSFSAFETSEDLISAMDFYLPHSVDTTNSRCRTSYELEQCISGLFQPSLGYLDAAQLPELELNFGGKYPAQNDAALRQDILAQRATGDLHQASHSRTVSTHEISLPDPEVHDPIQPQLNIPMLTNSSSNSIDNSSNDQNNIGNPRPIICNNKEDNTTRGEELDPTDAKIEAGTLEARFEYVIRAVEKSGFEGLDDMMTQYYTATFKEERILHWAQSRSRSRSLPTLLASLHENTRKWPDRDAHGYRQAILQSAEHIYLSELASARSNLEEDEQRHNPGEEKETSSVDEMLATSKDLWKVITELDENEHIRQKKAIIRDNMPEIWSLLIEFTRKAALRQPHGRQCVGAFLLLLLTP